MNIITTQVLFYVKTLFSNTPWHVFLIYRSSYYIGFIICKHYDFLILIT